MILDSLVEFAAKTALSTGGTGRALVGNVIDLGAPPLGSTFRDIGNGRPIHLVILITTPVTSGGAATASFELSSDTVANIAVDGTTEHIHITTPVTAKATLVAGYSVFTGPIPWEGVTYQRYLGIVQNVGTAALTAGNFSAFLTLDPAAWKAYTAGVGL